MWLTAATGDIVPKDVAAEWAEKQTPPEQAMLLKCARDEYLGMIEDRWEGNQEDFKALVAYMEESIEERLDVRQ